MGLLTGQLTIVKLQDTFAYASALRSESKKLDLPGVNFAPDQKTINFDFVPKQSGRILCA